MAREIVALPLSRKAGVARIETQPIAVAWSPATDLFETAAGLVITVELAGLRRGDLELQVTGQELCLRGVRRDRFSPPEGRPLQRSIRYGTFESRLTVASDFDLTAARASYQNGFLRVEIPRRHPEPPGAKPTSAGPVEEAGQ